MAGDEEYVLLPENAYLQSGAVITADWVAFLCLFGPAPPPSCPSFSSGDCCVHTCVPEVVARVSEGEAKFRSPSSNKVARRIRLGGLLDVPVVRDCKNREPQDGRLCRARAFVQGFGCVPGENRVRSGGRVWTRCPTRAACPWVCGGTREYIMRASTCVGRIKWLAHSRRAL